MDALKVHDLLTTDRVDTEPAKARSFVIQLLSLSATKIADGPINPKLVLAWLLSALGAPGFIFAGQIAYEGARAGRKTHLTDMDTGDRKTVYTALSNTIIGVLLLVGAVFGVLSDVLGTASLLAIFAAMAAVSAALAWRMDET